MSFSSPRTHTHTTTVTFVLTSRSGMLSRDASQILLHTRTFRLQAWKASWQERRCSFRSGWRCFCGSVSNVKLPFSHAQRSVRNHHAELRRRLHDAGLEKPQTLRRLQGQRLLHRQARRRHAGVEGGQPVRRHRQDLHCEPPPPRDPPTLQVSGGRWPPPVSCPGGESDRRNLLWVQDPGCQPGRRRSALSAQWPHEVWSLDYGGARYPHPHHHHCCPHPGVKTKPNVFTHKNNTTNFCSSVMKTTRITEMFLVFPTEASSKASFFL